LIAAGVVCYYEGWNYLNSLPQDKDGVPPFLESRIGIMLVIGGIALDVWGFLWIKYECETEIERRKKES
jgi:hypothetical protein